MQITAMFQRGLAQVLVIAQVIAIIGEAGLAVVAALHDVAGNAGQVEAG